jgi:DNA polymerase elongation subunit (family B)
MDQIRAELAAGSSIKWVGYHSPMKVWVYTHHGKTQKKFVIELKKDYTEPSFRKIRTIAADDPGSLTGTIWASDTRLELLRLASIVGLNVGGSCTPGAGQEFAGTLGCIMAYDIEVDRSRIPSSSFPSPSESIISIATYCSCGDKMAFSFIPDIDFDYIWCRNSRETVSAFIEYVAQHSPQWLVGYNNFRFDNTCIAFHADRDKYDSIFIPMSIGTGSSTSYAYYIDIEGVYNIDLLTYLDKTRRAAYPNMSLATLAVHHGVGTKMEFDTGNVTDFAKLLEYNIHDSKITMLLATASDTLAEVTSIAVATASPIIDCIRFVSGTLAASSIGSYCLNNHICMDWSPCSSVREYRGAEVLKPIIGTHEDVVSCDFSSMYPTILLGANISPENYREQKTSALSGSVWKDGDEITFVVDDTSYIFNATMDCVVPPVMRLFVETRRRVRKTKPAYALGLKIAANSIYGSLGDRHSKIYSPACSAAVTTGGRWCLALAETILKMFGFQIVYGDTDSCFVARTKYATTDVYTATKILSRIFNFTPFPGMSMEVENRFSKIAFLGKKTYFGKLENGGILSKGMSKSRKDRIGICRTLSSLIVPIVLDKAPLRYRQEILGNMLTLTIDSIVLNKLTLEQVSKIVKRSGSNYYEYHDHGDKRSFVESESVTGAEHVAYSSKYVSKMLMREISAIFSITGVGSPATIMRYASDI